jgi:hypothetical protein
MCWTSDIGSAKLVICSGENFLEADPLPREGHGVGQHIRFATASQSANVVLRLAKCGESSVICVQATASIAAGEELLLKGPDCRLEASMARHASMQH